MAKLRHYRVADGFTHDGGVAEGGQIIREDALGAGWNPLSEDEQLDKFGRIMYEEVTAKEADEDLVEEIVPPEPRTPEDMTDEELLVYAKELDLDFPANAKRAQVLGAVKKKLSEKV
jgi:hypothetical protein